MKKLITFIVMGIILLIPNTVLAKDKITIYIFRGDECPHCEDALDFIYTNKDKIPDNVEIITYETWSNENNAKLLEKLDEYFEVEEKDVGSVPFIVVGTDYKLGMYGNLTDFNNLLDMAKKYETEEYEDIVAKTIKEMQSEDKSLKFKAYSLEKLMGPNVVGNIIVITVFGVIVLGFVGMIVVSRKK